MTIESMKKIKDSVQADESNQVDIELQSTSFDIWQQKYCLKKGDGSPVDKSVDATQRRVAKALAKIESPKKRKEWEERFFWALKNGAIPAGRILSNAGAEAYKADTSTINCTVSGTITDSMAGILEKNYEAGLTLKSGCGIGYEFSSLRPKGAYVSGAGAKTSGPLSFMDIFDKTCFTVSSAGGRRGAQMATFDVQHPDVLDFIRAKREDGRLRQFNLSLLISEEFIQAVLHDAQWPLVFPVKDGSDEHKLLDLKDPEQVLWRPWPSDNGYIQDGAGNYACKIYKKIPARRIWDAIMSSTYDFAEPGFILIDKVNEMNNNWYCESIRATNPCGEQPLPPYGSCLLGSVNLTKFVENQKTKKALLIANLSERANRLQRLVDALPAAYLPFEIKKILLSQAHQRVKKLVQLAPANKTFQKRLDSLNAQLQEQATPPPANYQLKSAEEAREIKNLLVDLSKVIEALATNKVLPVNNAQQFVAFIQNKHTDVSINVSLQLAEQSYKENKYRLAAHQYQKSMVELAKNNQNGEYNARIEQVKGILASLEQYQNANKPTDDEADTLVNQVDKLQEKDNAWKKKYF